VFDSNTQGSEQKHTNASVTSDRQRGIDHHAARRGWNEANAALERRRFPDAQAVADAEAALKLELDREAQKQEKLAHDENLRGPRKREKEEENTPREVFRKQSHMEERTRAEADANAYGLRGPDEWKLAIQRSSEKVKAAEAEDLIRDHERKLLLDARAAADAEASFKLKRDHEAREAACKLKLDHEGREEQERERSAHDEYLLRQQKIEQEKAFHEVLRKRKQQEERSRAEADVGAGDSSSKTADGDIEKLVREWTNLYDQSPTAVQGAGAGQDPGIEEAYNVYRYTQPSMPAGMMSRKTPLYVEVRPSSRVSSGDQSTPRVRRRHRRKQGSLPDEGDYETYD